MPPVIVDPYNYNKANSFIDTCVLVKEFLELNKIIEPNSIDTDPETTSWIRSKKLRYCTFGLYSFATTNLYVNFNIARSPVKVPVRSWTYTGYKSDLTVSGILAHEIGHHIENYYQNHVGFNEFKTAFKKFIKNEARVSGYEPNVSESFAEATKLFILNPFLLKEGRKNRWEFFTTILELKPVHDLHWKEILKNADQKLLNAANNWVKGK